MESWGICDSSRRDVSAGSHGQEGLQRRSMRGRYYWDKVKIVFLRSTRSKSRETEGHTERRTCDRTGVAGSTH